MVSDPVPYELPDEMVRDAWDRLIGDYLLTDGPLYPLLRSGSGPSGPQRSPSWVLRQGHSAC